MMIFDEIKKFFPTWQPYFGGLVSFLQQNLQCFVVQEGYRSVAGTDEDAMACCDITMCVA